MAVTVVLRHPRRHLLGRAWRQLVAFWAGALFVIGALATCVAFSMGIGLVMGVLLGQDSEDTAEAGNPWLKEMALAFGISLPIAIVGIRFGLRLLRGRRGLVLFLRRFGLSDTTKTVTFAAQNTVGGSWRLVTLDDEEIAPVGIRAGTRRAFSAAKLVGRAWNVFLQLPEFWVKRVIPLTVGAMLAVLAIALWRAPDWRAALDGDGTFDPYRDTVESLFHAEIPFDAIELSIPGVFAVVAILLAFEVAAMFVLLVALPALVVLFIVLLPLISIIDLSAEAAERAEKTTRPGIHVKEEIWTAADSVQRESRNVFAPRLFVLRVATPVWQQTVKGFAAVCSTSLIDLSDVSEHVLWEIEEMTRKFGPRCLFVGRYDRVAWLADPPARLGSDEQRLLRLVDGHEVLAYTTDRRGIRRFARSLRANLLTVTSEGPHMNRGGPRLRRERIPARRI